ncbi:hypothetical protein [Longimicrobium terrae]|uniref:DUF3108 domain-containing protein n=1 Tax=Longimicrobium terrae TaxID=1639882 RepID=A0A841GW56_9BACT|nr:hypothetical protein [Longimicrobium terrae]MBB4635389.1 hypothetical protein [Longimicrobium terrae]MBB6069783.1 hypothetical protein [Longimicrobium terrae]NNC31008.1 hypothetical protein [Longimicrobium terrae]
MIRPIPIALACCALLAAGARAQTTGTHADVRFDRLSPGADSMYVYVVLRDRQVYAGTVHDELRSVAQNGSPALLRVYRSNMGILGVRVDTMISAVPSGATLYASSTGTQPWRVRYAADSITGTRTDAQGVSRRIARAFRGPAYDGTMFDMMLRAAPLAQGYQFRVNAYHAMADSAMTVTATVAGSELVEVEGSRPVDAWRVNVDFAGTEVTMWIDQNTRALVRQLIQSPPYGAMLMTRVPPRP